MTIKKAILLPLSAAVLASCAYAPTHIGKSIEFKPVEETSSSDIVKDHYNILYIGNSFTYYNNIDEVTVALATSLGLNITSKKFAVGSQKLAQSASSEDALGAQIDADLNAHHDYTDIILQDQSTTPLSSYTSFLSGVAKLKKKINATQDRADIHLYETWSFPGMTGYANDLKGGEAALREAYRKAGSVMQIGVDYVGIAFQYINEHHPEINLYWSDNKHPSFAGTYLSAATHLATIANVDVTNATYIGSSSTFYDGVPCLLNQADANILLSVASGVASGAIK